ncbi:MAG: alpha/beta hydrolase [Firmicutes bacterium]|nr:alpha/beta hydrolase [Bacillota bacterium]
MLIALALVILFILLLSYGCYRYVFYSVPDPDADDFALSDPLQPEEQKKLCIEMISKLKEKPFERVYTYSFDGLKLAGRYYHKDDDAPLVIMCHGYTGTPSRDFCGGADICLSSGYNALLIEQRAHNGSEGRTISFGILERKDVLSWIDFALRKFGKDKEILLTGISMGAATVLMSIALGLPENVKGIIADCPYAYPEEIIKHVGKERHLPIGLLLPFIRLGARLFGHFGLSDGDAVSSVKRAEIPVMIIHGEADDFVPCEMSEEIRMANPEYVERHTFPGARHGVSYLTDRERYTKLVKDFYKKTFG